VIQASNNDFEEFGVDQSTLDEMKQVRCALPAGAPGAAAPISLMVASALRTFSLSHAVAFRLYSVLWSTDIDFAARTGGGWQPGGMLGLAKSGAE
jgi:hypothetical protein